MFQNTLWTLEGLQVQFLELNLWILTEPSEPLKRVTIMRGICKKSVFGVVSQLLTYPRG